MKCKLSQFNWSINKMGHLIWEQFPVLPIFSVQQTVWQWQAVPQPQAAVEPLIFQQPREGVKVWNEGFPSGNQMMTSRSPRSASSSTGELNNIPDQSCISLQTTRAPWGGLRLVPWSRGRLVIFARCMVLVILLCVRLGRIFPWCQLSWCPFWYSMWSLCLIGSTRSCV